MENDNNTWYGDLHRRTQTMNINTSVQSLKNKKKSVWKQEVKKKILKAIEQKYEEETANKTKLRFQQGKTFGKEEYVEQCDARMCEKIMNLRLNMVNCKMNFKNANEDTTCLVCDHSEETTEHLLECEHYKQFTGGNLKPISSNELKSVEWLKKAVSNMDIIQEVRQQHNVIGPALKGSTF